MKRSAVIPAFNEAATINEYAIRSFVTADRNSFEDLYRAVYGEAWRTKTNFAWSIDNSRAPAGAAVAVSGDTIVAAQPYCDLPLHTPWGSGRGTLLLDVATHPDHQRRGLFRRVVEAAKAAAFERGTSIVMTTPNRIASQGFRCMPTWQRLCSLDCLLLPLGVGDSAAEGGLLALGARVTFSAAALLRYPKSAAVVSRVPDGVETPWRPGSEADDLWRDAARRDVIMVARDRGFLHWRFGPDYRLFLARDGRSPVGYAAARVVTRAGLKLGLVLDCVAAGDGTSAVRLLASVVHWMREQGASAALGYFLPRSPAWDRAREAGFLRLPRAFTVRDYPVYVAVRPESGHRTQLLNGTRWHLTLADSDLV
jgi:GNAT superfamily N-acetyltransferase